MRDPAKSIRSTAMKTFAAALIAAGALSLAPESAIARHSPQPWWPGPQGEGIVNRIDVVKRTINVTHDRIDLLNLPATTTDFRVAEGVGIGALKRGATIIFGLARGKDGRFVIEEIKPSE